MTAEKNTAMSERTPEQNGAVHAATHLVEILAKNAEDLKNRLTDVARRGKTLRNVFADAADALNSSGKTVTDGVIAFNTEVLKFAKVSAKEGLDAAKTVVNANSLEDVVHAESRYLQWHITASIDAGRKLVEIWAETGRNAMKPIARGLSTAASKENDSKAAA